MTQPPARLLILACGNTLRGDDGVGPSLAEWAAARFYAEHAVRVVSRQQWTPELAEEIAGAEFLLFIDCSTDSEPGKVELLPIEAATGLPEITTHRLGAAELLALARELYHAVPRKALVLTVGAGSLEFSEKFSAPVNAALPQARSLLERTVARLLV